MSTLINVIHKVLFMNREISVRNDTDKCELVISVTAFNKIQNIKSCYSYKVEKNVLIKEEELAEIIYLLNQRFE